MIGVARIPADVVLDGALSAESVRLYAYLTMLDRVEGEITGWPGRETAAEHLGWSVRTVDRWLAALVERGAISRRQGGGGSIGLLRFQGASTT